MPADRPRPSHPGTPPYPSTRPEREGSDNARPQATPSDASRSHQARRPSTTSASTPPSRDPPAHVGQPFKVVIPFHTPSHNSPRSPATPDGPVQPAQSNRPSPAVQPDRPHNGPAPPVAASQAGTGAGRVSDRPHIPAPPLPSVLRMPENPYAYVLPGIGRSILVPGGPPDPIPLCSLPAPGSRRMSEFERVAVAEVERRLSADANPGTEPGGPPLRYMPEVTTEWTSKRPPRLPGVIYSDDEDWEMSDPEEGNDESFSAPASAMGTTDHTPARNGHGSGQSSAQRPVAGPSGSTGSRPPSRQVDLAAVSERLGQAPGIHSPQPRRSLGEPSLLANSPSPDRTAPPPPKRKLEEAQAPAPAVRPPPRPPAQSTSVIRPLPSIKPLPLNTPADARPFSSSSHMIEVAPTCWPEGVRLPAQPSSRPPAAVRSRFQPSTHTPAVVPQSTQPPSHAPAVVRPSIQAPSQPLAVVGPSIQPSWQPPATVRPSGPPTNQPPAVAIPSSYSLPQRPSVGNPSSQPLAQWPTVLRTTVQPPSQQPAVAQPPTYPLPQPPVVMAPSIQMPAVAPPSTYTLPQPPAIVRPSVQPLAQSPTAVRPPVQPPSQPSAAVRPSGQLPPLPTTIMQPSAQPPAPPTAGFQPVSQRPPESVAPYDPRQHMHVAPGVRPAPAVRPPTQNPMPHATATRPPLLPTSNIPAQAVSNVTGGARPTSQPGGYAANIAGPPMRPMTHHPVFNPSRLGTSLSTHGPTPPQPPVSQRPFHPPMLVPANHHNVRIDFSVPLDAHDRAPEGALSLLSQAIELSARDIRVSGPVSSIRSARMPQGSNIHRPSSQTPAHPAGSREAQVSAGHRLQQPGQRAARPERKAPGPPTFATRPLPTSRIDTVTPPAQWRYIQGDAIFAVVQAPESTLPRRYVHPVAVEPEAPAPATARQAPPRRPSATPAPRIAPHTIALPYQDPNVNLKLGNSDFPEPSFDEMLSAVLRETRQLSSGPRNPRSQALYWFVADLNRAQRNVPLTGAETGRFFRLMKRVMSTEFLDDRETLAVKVILLLVTSRMVLEVQYAINARRRRTERQLTMLRFIANYALNLFGGWSETLFCIIRAIWSVRKACPPLTKAGIVKCPPFLEPTNRPQFLEGRSRSFSI